jgi:enoyl-[acyl-carrier protein] reductase/trans-2-enoyl-CoA reductase (NAD+)
MGSECQIHSTRYDDFAAIRNGVGMIIEPRVRGFICTTAHPVGCLRNVRDQIAYVLGKGAIPGSPKRVAVLGCSTGYGLASRIVATFAGGAETIGVSLEREPTANRTASAGWYNNRAFEIEAEKIGRSPLTLEGDAFSDEMKKTFIDRVREKFGQLDMLVYSMAAPARTDPQTGKTYRSAIKPLGAPVEIKTLNTETGEVFETTITPASEEEAAATVAVMGGEDWKRWIDQLADAGVLAPGFRTLNYTYIGSELTWPIYWNGTLGRAKVDLDRKAEAIRGLLGQEDAARVVALKAVVTQASSAIPVVPLYGTVLFKVMKQLGLHEGCIEQIDRLFRTRLGKQAEVDDAQRLRLDDWELSPKVQAEVSRRWPLLSTETLDELADLAEYKSQFLRLFGFGIDGVDYAQDIDPRVVPG